RAPSAVVNAALTIHASPPVIEQQRKAPPLSACLRIVRGNRSLRSAVRPIQRYCFLVSGAGAVRAMTMPADCGRGFRSLGLILQRPLKECPVEPELSPATIEADATILNLDHRNSCGSHIRHRCSSVMRDQAGAVRRRFRWAHSLRLVSGGVW